MSNVAVTWDYTSLAKHYDKRADYADDAIKKMLALAKPNPATPIADIGAGTGKLTVLLLAHGYSVKAVEPNQAMREIGQKNTEGKMSVILICSACIAFWALVEINRPRLRSEKL